MNGPNVRRGERAPFQIVRSLVVVLPMENVDTDQIIPARFLKITGADGLGEHLFEDLRRNPDGTLREEFPLNVNDKIGASILLAGHNFGCGSSREHAAWALAGAGFRVIISTAFADIFRSNAMKNGVLPVVVDTASWGALDTAARGRDRVTVDLERQEVGWTGGATRFSMDPFARTCLLAGTDELGFILQHESDIAGFEARRAQEEIR